MAAPTLKSYKTEGSDKKEGSKPLTIYHVKQTSLFRIGREGGGPVPRELDGMYTDRNKAEVAVSIYKTNLTD